MTDKQDVVIAPSESKPREWGLDIIAGLSIAGLLLPEAVAYASIANLPPQAGIIALFAGLLCYFCLGSSRFAIVSATSSSAAVLAAATASMAANNPGLRVELAMGLVLVTGLFFLLAALLRLGSITEFIAKPVLRGFAFGLAVTIIIRQFATIVDVHPEHHDLLRFTPELLQQVTQWNSVGLLIGGVSLLLLYLFSHFHRIPGGLVVISLGIIVAQFYDLSAHGVKLVGEIDMQLTAPALPDLSRREWLRLGELGIALGLILYSESYGAIRSFAIKHNDTISPNRDLLAIGVANIVSALFHGQAVGAGYSGTSANEAAGATTRLAGLYAMLVVLVIVLLLLSAIAFTPEPVLAAIVIHAVSHALTPKVFKPYFAWQRDRVVLISAIVCVLLFGVLDGLLAAIGISLLMLLKRLSRSTIAELGRLGESHEFVHKDRHPTATGIPEVLIFRPEQPLFFANTERVLTRISQQFMAGAEEYRGLIISLEETPDLDGSSLEVLQNFFNFIEQQQKFLVMARLKASVYQLLSQMNIEDSERILLSDLSVDEAVILMQRRLTK